VAELLIAKNAAYGNSALDPVRIYSRANPAEQIRVRIDDKLSRLARGHAAGEDVTLDLLGYLVLLRIAEGGGDDRPVGAVIRDARITAGLSLRKCADLTGTSVVTLGAIERGVRPPSKTEAIALAWALGLDAVDIERRARSRRPSQGRLESP
jgi:DNA-binding XRE family transcriptional regulator